MPLSEHVFQTVRNFWCKPLKGMQLEVMRVTGTGYERQPNKYLCFEKIDFCCEFDVGLRRGPAKVFMWSAELRYFDWQFLALSPIFWPQLGCSIGRMCEVEVEVLLFFRSSVIRVEFRINLQLCPKKLRKFVGIGQFGHHLRKNIISKDTRKNLRRGS